MARGGAAEPQTHREGAGRIPEPRPGRARRAHTGDPLPPAALPSPASTACPRPTNPQTVALGRPLRADPGARGRERGAAARADGRRYYVQWGRNGGRLNPVTTDGRVTPN